MSKKEYPYICILDCYFEQMNKDGSYYRISDEDLSKLVINIREIEFTRDKEIARFKRYAKICNNHIKKLERERHVYKVELGRCVRKLTRIYQEVLAIGYLLHYINGNECSPKDLVDSFKCL